MVKSVKQAVQEVVHGKQQNIEISFHPDNWGEKDNKVIEHKDIAGYSINSEWVATTEKDGTTYVYPARDVARIKHYSV